MKDISAPEDERTLQALRAYAKRELRERMQAVRNVLPRTAHAERSARACARIIALDAFEPARTIAGFCSMRKELDPRAALLHALEQGKRVALPRVDMAANDLVFHLYRNDDTLIENGWDILEPAQSAERVDLAEIDLVLVPALALDLRGYRLGYGKGFYDRVLPGMINACSVGLAYDFQLLAEVPDEPHDVALDIVVSDQRTVACAHDRQTTPG